MNEEQFQAGTARFEQELEEFLLKHADLPPAETFQTDLYVTSSRGRWWIVRMPKS